MGGTSGLTVGNIALFVFMVVTQILAVSLLPRTAGFTSLQWTAACLGVYAISLGSLARILHMGVPLGLMIPIMSALIPLATIAIGVMVYGEAAPPLRILLLCGACGLIAVASTVR